MRDYEDRHGRSRRDRDETQDYARDVRGIGSPGRPFRDGGQTMRTVLIGAAVALALAAGGAGAAEVGSPGATPLDGRGTPPAAGSTTTTVTGSGSTTTTTTTTVYTPGTAVLPPTGYTPYSPSDYRTPDQGESGVSPRAGQTATGSHCPPGTLDCGGANR